jgi:ATP-dependent Lhr-like helicase
MSYALLSAEMQRAVFDLGWPALWPVQEQAIAALLGGSDHVLILGDTASGKTEAAFLPIFSQRLAGPGFSVLYVSPLRALLNDQAERLRRLGAYAGVPVHLWHSDVTRSAKRRTQEAPGGVLLTTPESLEAMCIHRPLHLPVLFAGLRFVVIDELHAFLGTGRGIQLGSLLQRIGRYAHAAPRRVALSATIGDPARARAFLGEPCAVCSGGGPRKRTLLHLRYDPDDRAGADLLALTRGRKALIFCNTRARVETLTQVLGGGAGGALYLPHHGSLHGRERALAEESLRREASGAIVCTSTLELGIDVGAVDLVAQVDCTHSVVSLRQRLGRSGRAPGADRCGQIYAGGEPELVQSVAVVELLRQGWVEPPPEAGPAHDVAWQQTLSRAVERGGLDPEEVGHLPPDLLAHMLASDHLAQRDGRLVAGARGEDIARRRDFCAVFHHEEAYLVVAGTRQLGQLPPLPIYREGVPLLFAGRRWTILEVDHARRRIELAPGAAGHPPVFTSRPLRVHPHVRQEMVRVLLSDELPRYLDPRGQAVLTGLRSWHRRLGLGPVARPALVAPHESQFLAFAGDTAANTLALLLQRESGLPWEATAWGGVLATEAWPALPRVLEELGRRPPPAGPLREELMELVPDRALVLPKFAHHLPPRLRRELHAASELDVPGALALLSARLQTDPGS